MVRFAAGPFHVQGVDRGQKVVATYVNTGEEVVIKTGNSTPYLDSKRNLYVSTDDPGLKPYKTVAIPTSAKKKKWDEVLGIPKAPVSRALRSKVVETAPPAAEVPAVGERERVAEPVKAEEVEEGKASILDLPGFAQYKEKLSEARRILESLNIGEVEERILVRNLQRVFLDQFVRGYIYIGDRGPWKVRVRYDISPPESLEALVALLLLVNSEEAIVNSLKKLLGRPAYPPYATYYRLDKFLVNPESIWNEAEERIKKSQLSEEEAEAVKSALRERHFSYESIPPSEAVRRRFFNSLERAISTVTKLLDSGPRIYYVEVGDGEAVLVSFWRGEMKTMLLVDGVAYTSGNRPVLKSRSNREAAEKLVAIAKTIHDAWRKAPAFGNFFDDPKVAATLAPLVPVAREAMHSLDELWYQDIISSVIAFSVPNEYKESNVMADLSHLIRHVINRHLGVDSSITPEELSIIAGELRKKIAQYLSKNPDATASDVLQAVMPKARWGVRDLVERAGPFAELAIEKELDRLKEAPEAVRLLIARGVEFEEKSDERYSKAYFTTDHVAGYFPSSESLKIVSISNISELIPVYLVYDEEEEMYRLGFHSEEDEKRVDPELKKYGYNQAYVDATKKLVNEGETYVSPRGLLVIGLKPGGYFVIAPRIPP
ncbi:MAG: hypothetical protein QXO20_08665 [Candidatus Bathyarchaeia archaeon]